MSAPLQILIVDDEAPARNRLRDLLTDCAAELPTMVVGEAANGVQALQVLEHTAVDVVLLDIRMPVMDGLELAQHLGRLDTPPAVVFATAYDSYAIQAFELSAVDYLLKPVRSERLVTALRKAQALNPATTALLRQHHSEARRFSAHASADGFCWCRWKKSFICVPSKNTWQPEPSLIPTFWMNR